jgi:hypothetical protein
MPSVETLILAVAKADDGLRIAGMTAERDPVTGLRWILLGSESGWFRPSDWADAKGPLLRPFDIVALNLLFPDPRPPYTERWVAGLSPDRLRIARRLEGTQRARFLGKYADSASHQVLDSQQRSLCLIRPAWVHGSFRLDPSSGRFDARLAFGLGRRAYRGPFARGGFVVADPSWLALGRSWLPEAGGWTEFDAGDLEARFGSQEIFLVVGLAQSAGRDLEPTILAVHALPDVHAVAGQDAEDSSRPGSEPT